jgi:hypothetical protein
MKFPNNIFNELQTGNLDILYQESNDIDDALGMKQLNISLFRDYFTELVSFDKHSVGWLLM